MISGEELREAFIKASMVPKEYFGTDFSKLKEYEQMKLQLKFDKFIKHLRNI